MPAAKGKVAKLTKPAAIRGGHNISSFDCGEPALNLWLEKHALIANDARTANTFVVCRGRRIVGYYSLANGAVDHASTSAAVRRNMPDPIPATILARLAVDNSERGRGLGADLLVDAGKRVLNAARHSAARLLIVHPLNDNAASFYSHFGFRNVRGDTTSAMYMTLKSLVDAL